MPTGTQAQQCHGVDPASAHPSRFEMRADGTAIDARAGRMWMRCALGQVWADGDCGATFDLHDFDGARDAARRLNAAGGFAGHRDWRVPEIEELVSLVEPACFNPAIDMAVFPHALVTGYWSASVASGYAKGAWLVHLHHGGRYVAERDGSWVVRLVRDMR